MLHVLNPNNETPRATAKDFGIVEYHVVSIDRLAKALWFIAEPRIDHEDPEEARMAQAIKQLAEDREENCADIEKLNYGR